jgi:GNAT superfamily N-acetyltransferase
MRGVSSFETRLTPLLRMRGEGPSLCIFHDLSDRASAAAATASESCCRWIHRQWWSETDTSPEAIECWLSTHLNEERFPTTFIAVCDGEVVGSVSLHETEADDSPAYRPYLGALYVKPDHRRCGLGTILIRSVEAHASRLGYATVYLNAADTLTDFYERLVWEILQRLRPKAAQHHAAIVGLAARFDALAMVTWR